MAAAAERKTWLRQWREREERTQDECAEAVGVSRNRWSEIENFDKHDAGQSPPSFPVAEKLEALTGIQITNLFRTDKLRLRRR